MKLSRHLLLIPFVALAFSLAAAEPTVWTAKIGPSDALLRGWGFPAYWLDVRFPKAFSTNLVSRANNYVLFRSDAPEKLIEIRRVKVGGNQYSDDLNGQASQVTILPAGDLTPPPDGIKYLVEVQFGSESSGEIEAVWANRPPRTPSTPPSDNELVNLISMTTNFLFGPLSAKIDARSIFEGNHAPAFDFEVKYDLASGPLFPPTNHATITGMWIGGANLAADGTYKVDRNDTNIADHLSASLNFDLLRIYRLPNPLTDHGRLAYYVGFRLKGFELESDQDFDVVNWSIQPQLALWVPYSNLPGLWWVRRMNIHANAATPLFVYAGYSFVEALETETAKVARDIQEADRLELELAYAFPVTSSLRLGLRSRHFWLQQGHGQRNYQELFARYYLNNAKTTALLFKYTRGALPPKFEEGEGTGVGVSFDF